MKKLLIRSGIVLLISSLVPIVFGIISIFDPAYTVIEGILIGFLAEIGIAITFLILFSIGLLITKYWE